MRSTPSPLSEAALYEPQPRAALVAFRVGDGRYVSDRRRQCSSVHSQGRGRPGILLTVRNLVAAERAGRVSQARSLAGP